MLYIYLYECLSTTLVICCITSLVFKIETSDDVESQPNTFEAEIDA